MKQTSLLSLIMSASLLVFGSNAESFTGKIDGFSHPESVICNADACYVSDIGAVLNPKAKDGDGLISKISKDGVVVKKAFHKTKLDSPKGLLIVGDTLYTADVDRVVGFDLASGEQTFELSFADTGTLFLNALALKNETTLFVSATDIGAVYEFGLGSDASYTLVAKHIRGPNGLVWDGSAKKLYIVGWGDGKPNGEPGYLDLTGSTPTYHTLGIYQGYLDGLVMAAPGALLFSDWVAFEKVGVLNSLDIATGKVTHLSLPEVIGGPADFFRDADGTLWIPMMMEGKVMVVKP